MVNRVTCHFPPLFFLKIIFFLLICKPVEGQPVSFRKVNSGTRSDIRNIIRDKDRGVYFVTDKIYALQNDRWQKLGFPVEGKVFYCNSISPRDIWFNINQVTSTCLLYHYHDAITENIRTPLANSITAMFFIDPGRALFAGFADIAAYENGTFRILPPSPSRSSIVSIYSEDLNDFYILSGSGELFLYEHGRYNKLLAEQTVTDFCFTDMHNGYLLAGDGLFRVDGSGVRLIYENTDFRRIHKMNLLPNGSVLMVGDKGLIMTFEKGRLIHHAALCTEDLTDLVVTGENDIWISGENGRLLYSGEKQFPVYVEDNHGFASYKLIGYGINTDDEYGVAMADFNGDTKTDIYTMRIYEQNRLYINNLSQSQKISFMFGFSEEAVKRNASGVMNPGKSMVQNELKLGVNAADIDNDNDQDLYFCYLNSFNRLLLNRGKGYFRNVSTQKNRACENMKRSNSSAFSDVDNDGDLDLFVTNEEGSNRLLENNGTGHFKDITVSSGLGSTGGGMCASFADVNSDGFQDLCVTFWYPSNRIYINDSKPGRIHFRDATRFTDLRKAAPSKSNGLAFADVNNDGYTDLFIANRNTGNKLYLNDGHGVFTDKTQDYLPPETTMSNGVVFADFDLDGYQDLYVTNVGENVLYKNMGGLYFQDVTASFGAELTGYCTGCATGDVDNDGDPDLYVANYINGNSSLFLNITEKRNFVKVKLHGVRSNKDAIGAKVWLYQFSGDKQQGVLAGYRELDGGSGYGSVSAREMIFGVVPGAEYFAVVKFPSSPDTIRIDHISAGNTLEIPEMMGFPAFYTENLNRAFRFFKDQENQPEIIKYSLVFLLLVLYNLRLHKSVRSIAVFRWLTSGLVFVVFVFVNQVFLFQWYTVSYFIAPITVFGLLAIQYLFIDGILLKRLAQKEKYELREKLSRDLHDDLASTLGSISIYAETLKGMKEPMQPEFHKLPVKISGLTQSALQSISDIIWMTSPRNDSLQSLMSKTRNYMLEILTDNKIRFRSTIKISEEPVILQEKIRNDAFLILKEGVHNILRHSGAKNVEFFAELTDNRCTILLKDDGVGFNDPGGMKKETHGHGLVNMRKRAQESGIGFRIHSVEGVGTEINLVFKI